MQLFWSLLCVLGPGQCREGGQCAWGREAAVGPFHPGTQPLAAQPPVLPPLPPEMGDETTCWDECIRLMQ